MKNDESSVPVYLSIKIQLIWLSNLQLLQKNFFFNFKKKDGFGMLWMGFDRFNQG